MPNDPLYQTQLKTGRYESVRCAISFGSRTLEGVGFQLCLVLLSSSIRRSHYYTLEASRDRDAIAEFFVERFFERYVIPIESTPRTAKHGFTIMAVSCLLIETLESFWCGWPTTERQSKLAFCQFFSRTRRFHALLGRVPDFYKHVRCGILHQAETTGGWTVLRMGDLFAPSGPTLNATKFHRELQK